MFLENPKRTMSPAKLQSFGLIAVLILAVAVSNPAQSGRRLPGSQTSPGSITPTNTEVNRGPAPALLFRVVLLIGRQSTSRHLRSEDTIYASFIQRLNEFVNVTGTSVGEVSRKDATQRARAETDALVVFLDFDIDSLQGRKVVFDSSDLEINYFLFEPITGKQITRGKVYYRAIGGAGSRRSNSPTDPPVKITAEAAGIETAERLHDWLVITGRRMRIE